MRTKIYQKPSVRCIPSNIPQKKFNTVHASTFDITKKENCEILQSIVGSIQDIIVIFDKNSKFIHILGDFQEKMGVDPKTLIGKSFFDLLPKDIALYQTY